MGKEITTRTIHVGVPLRQHKRLRLAGLHLQEVLVEALVQGGDGGCAAQEDGAVPEVGVIEQQSEAQDGGLELVIVQHRGVGMSVLPRNLECEGYLKCGLVG